MTTWKVRSLRLTLFIAPDGASATELRWEQLVGAKPESTMSRGNQEYQEGPLETGRLLLQKQQGRVDLLYVGSSQADQPQEPVATLGDFEPACERLRVLAQKVFGKVTHCVRLALGAELVQPAATSSAAYKMLVDHMRSAKFTFEGGQEFVYQMNRPRKSSVIPSLTINRLTRWNASSWQPVTLELGPGVRALSGPPRVGAVVTTDVNTDGERSDPLATDKLLDLFDELCDLTIEIRDRGDVP